MPPHGSPHRRAVAKVAVRRGRQAYCWALLRAAVAVWAQACADSTCSSAVPKISAMISFASIGSLRHTMPKSTLEYHGVP
jgi:hypothetical protein